MKNKWITMILCGLMAVNLVACQSTPEEVVVVDKSEGLPKGSIIEVDDETSKDLHIPEKWEETMERQDGYVTITADCEMDISDIYNTPVYEYEMQEITEEKLQELCEYFAEGNKLYAEPAMTKAELQQDKAEMMEQTGFWRSEVFEKVDELIETATDETTYQYVDAKFATPYQTEYEKITSEEGNARSMVSDYYFDTEEKIGLKVRVAKGKDVNPQIKVINYNEELGSTSNFTYSQGTFIDEKWLEKSWDTHKTLEYGEEGENDLERLQNQMDSFDDAAFTSENALDKVAEVLADLSLEGYIVTDCYKAIGTPEYDGYVGIYKDDLTLISGYSVYLSHEAGSLSGYENPFGRPFTDLPEQTYTPSFSTEKIHIIVTEEEIQLFEWTNISEKTEVIAENTKLLGFEEIKGKFADHLLYKVLASLGEDSKDHGDLVNYKVKDVELRAVNVPAFENPSAVWLVPAWVFTVEEEWTTEAMGTLYMGEAIVVLNAIDGGYVMPRIDSRIPMR